MSSDLVPRIDDFRPMVLRVLADDQPRHRQEIGDLVADLAQLGPEARSQTVPSGQKRYLNRLNWALSALAQGGLLARPKRGWYQITDNGHTVDERNLSSYSEKDMLEWPVWRAYQEEIAARKQSDPQQISNDVPIDNLDASEDTEELIASASKTFNAKVETNLRRRLQESTPDFFEKAVLELLWAMGYGGAHGSKEHLGQSGDGGIDGVIRQDALGLSKVYVQAKRYADGNTVGNEEIRNFIGALDSKGSTQGVFITSSKFTSSAISTAHNYRHGTIVLIDGIELTRLMLSYGVAVQKHRTFTLFEIDEDFFEDSET